MTTRADIVIEARRWIGTPFAWRGRGPTGLDCTGLLAVVAHACGLSDYDYLDYDRSAPPGKLFDVLSQIMVPVPLAQMRPGDAVCLLAGRRLQHAGVLSEIGIIHTYQDIGKVAEHRLDDKWRRAIRAAFAFPGIS